MLKQLKQAIARRYSIRLGPYVASLKIGRFKTGRNGVDDPWAEFNLRQAIFLRSKYPCLEQMQIPLNQDNAADILQCFLEIIPAIDPEAREVCIRNALHQMRSHTTDSRLKTHATREIARSDLRIGIPDRAVILRDDEMLRADLEKQLALSDQAYGAQLLTQPWPDVSRGRSLCYYFQEHEELLRGKKILHFSPEPELRDWMQHRASELGLVYQTSNIMGDDVDMNQDLTAMTIQTTYDLVICHRVLEHVLDDRAAFQELYRIVKPGGCLQISVPQSMHQPTTREWIIQDQTHHEHVRHYGRDFSARLTAAGFEVEEEPWLLQRPREELLANGAYPLRMYNARKRLQADTGREKE